MDDSQHGNAQDWLRLGLAWAWFFLVLFAYYCLKPVRDALASGLAKNLGDLYLATFLTTVATLSVYSWLITRLSRRRLVVWVHHFFAVHLVAFWALFRTAWADSPALAAGFFVWVSVFNLFAVTLFWSVMTDCFSAAEGKKWFGILAAAGSVGSIAGSALAFQMAVWFGPHHLLLVALSALELAVLVAILLFRFLTKSGRGGTDQPVESTADGAAEQGTGGSIFAGLTHVLRSPYLLGICGVVALGKLAATFIYNQLQLQLDTQLPDRAARTVLFSQMNLIAQSGSLIGQSVIVGALIRRCGVAATLAFPSGCLLGFFLWLTFDPQLKVLIVGQVGQQILGYGILVPTQHLLFTVVSREEKYKSKAFTDTVVFRGSDVVAGKLCDVMARSTATLGTLAALLLPAIVAWMGISWRTGRAYQRLAQRNPPE